MGFNTYFYGQFKDQIQEEKMRYKAREEVQEVSFTTCSHKDVFFTHGELRCPCGASWGGRNLEQLYQHLANHHVR